MCNIYLGGKKKNRDAVRNLFLFFGRQNSLLNFVNGVVEWSLLYLYAFPYISSYSTISTVVF